MSGEASLPIFSLRPDWSQGIMERLSWRTDVLQAQDASEQLRGTRRSPRRLWEFAVLAERNERRFVQHLAFGNGAGRWQLPVWTDGVPLSAALASGSTVVPVDTVGREFAPGFAVILGEDAREAELLTVSGVTSTQLTVTATTRAWGVGAVVCPAVVARMDGAHALQAFTGDAGYGVARFNAAQANPMASTAPATIYRGLPVFDFPIVTPRDPVQAFDRTLEAWDDDIGIPAVFDLAGMPLPRQQLDVCAHGRTEIAQLRALLGWMDGMREALWLSTYQQDLRVLANIGSSATQITVAASNYTLDVAMELNRRDIRIETWSGASYHRRITACAAPGDGTELLTIDSALGSAVNAIDVKRVSFLQLVRSDSDLFELGWWTGDTVDLAMGFKGLRRDV